MRRILSNKRAYFACFGAIGGLLSGLTYHLIDPEPALLTWLVGIGFNGVFMAALLGLGQGWYLEKGFDSRGFANTAVIGGVGGIVGGLVGFYGAFPLMGTFGGGEDSGRFLGWTIGGLAVGFAVSRVVPNLKAVTACVAGAIGGCAGCGLMYLIGTLAGLGAVVTMGKVIHDSALVVGMATTGAAIGLAIAFAETTFRKAWLEVTIRPRGVTLAKERTLTVTLGDTPVLFGCGMQADVRLEEMAGAKPEFARVSLSNGTVSLHNMVTGEIRLLSVNDSFEVSNARVVVRSKSN